MRAARRHLRNVCKGNDPNAMRRALLDYVALYSGCPRSVAASQLRQYPQCAAVLDRLNRAVYGAEDIAVTGNEVLAAIPRPSQRTGSAQTDALPQLFTG